MLKKEKEKRMKGLESYGYKSKWQKEIEQAEDKEFIENFINENRGNNGKDEY